MIQPCFAWLSDAAFIPGRWDLRLLDWRLDPGKDSCGTGNECPALLDWRVGSRPGNWRQDRAPQHVIAMGVDDGEERACLLAQGFGDVVPTGTALVELAARMLKLEKAAPSLPRELRAGPVTLDLFHRDGHIAGKWLGLHPREFALLWRLAETPDRRVSRRELLADVWRLDHVPETNSLEVHVSRLRAKLAISRACWLVETDPAGGYRLGHGAKASFFDFSTHGSSAQEQDGLDRNRSVADKHPNRTLLAGLHHGKFDTGYD